MGKLSEWLGTRYKGSGLLSVSLPMRYPGYLVSFHASMVLHTFTEPPRRCYHPARRYVLLISRTQAAIA